MIRTVAVPIGADVEHIDMGLDEITDLRAGQNAAQADALKEQTRQAAIAALAKSDTTIIRCAENGIPVPAEWRLYRTALRAVLDGSFSGSIPLTPAFPPGT